MVFPYQAPREMEGAMLVGVREFVEMPERAFPAIPCAAVCYRERLLGVYYVDMGLVDPWKKLPYPFAHEATLRHIDRELNPGWRKLVVLPNVQLMGKVIETAPEIVNDLADSHAPYWIGFALDIDPPPRLRAVPIVCKA